MPKYVLPEKKNNSEPGKYGAGRKVQRPGLEKNSWSRGSAGREYFTSTAKTTHKTPAAPKSRNRHGTDIHLLFVLYF